MRLNSYPLTKCGSNGWRYTNPMGPYSIFGNISDNIALNIFFNKILCIIFYQVPKQGLHNQKPREGLASQPWSLCTVKQVEELKYLLKILPIWSTGIFIAATISQHSLYLIQANATSRHHFTPHFQVQAGSFVVFTILTMILTIAVIDRAIVPIPSRHTRQPRGLTFKQRMGIGLAISCLATTVAALVESKRRKQGINGEIMSAGEIFIKNDIIKKLYQQNNFSKILTIIEWFCNNLIRPIFYNA